MSTLTDINTISRGCSYQHVPIAAGIIILCGTLLCLTAESYLTDGGEETGTIFAGISAEYQDNTAGDDGALRAKVYTEGQFKLTGSGFTRGDVGKDVFILDNATVGLVGDVEDDRYVRAGRIVEYVSAEEVWVDIETATMAVTSIADAASAQAAAEAAQADADAALATVHPPVATTAALKAIGSASRVDGMLCYVIADRYLWAFDADDATGADDTHLAPDVGTGRWVPASDYFAYNGYQKGDTALNAVSAYYDQLVFATVAVPDVGGGGTDAALTLQLYRAVNGAAIASVRQILLIATATQYAPNDTLVATTAFATATVGSIIASGAGWALVATSAAGAFACTLSDSANETVYVRARTDEGVSDAAARCVVAASNSDAATWS